MTNVPTNDIDPGNNDYSVCLPVMNSYDPNVKEVSPKGISPDGLIPLNTGDLSYTIHFQNTGTIDAYNIGIIDTLNSNIDPKSLVITGTSHIVSPEWLAPGVVKFNFYNIQLPDSSSNEAASHGAIRFKVKLNAGLPSGTQIRNRANIYFDYNAPIATNTTLNTLDYIEGVNDQTSISGNLKVYPNPSNGKFTIEITGNKEQPTVIDIYNMFGEKVYSMPTVQMHSSYSMDLSELSKGIYFVRLVGKEKSYTEKIVLQ